MAPRPGDAPRCAGGRGNDLKIHPGIAAAIGAAVLFGLSTPLAKTLVGSMPALLLAGLLYVGSGIGLAALLAIRVATGGRQSITWPRGNDVWWLLGAIAVGGAIGPYLLMYGLQTTDSASASLILNLEGVFTALLAWFVFNENFDRRIAVGMALIVAGGVLLSIGPAFDAGDATLAVALGAPLTVTLVAAGLLMGAGVWLHLTERHDHRHRHIHVEHTHAHTHDGHHQHLHGPEWHGKKTRSHSHSHVHEPLEHVHAHFPDVHHRHEH